MPFLKCDIILHCRRQRNKDIDSQHWWRNCATQTMWNTRRTCWSSSAASLSTRRKYKIVFELETSFSVSLVFNITFVCFIFSSKSHEITLNLKKKTKNLNTQYPKLTNAIMYGQEIRGTDVVP